MRSDIRPGGTISDYALPDQTNTERSLSELQCNDPLVLTLARRKSPSLASSVLRR